MSVRFGFAWVDAPPCPDRTEQRTMATLSIKAGNAVVTSVVDNRSHCHRNHVVVPLLHVAEWLVANWWHLWYEFEDGHQQRPGFSDRHNLATAGEGFLLPHLEIVPRSRRVELRWKRWRPRHSQIEFIHEGMMHVERDELEHQLRDLIDAVLERIRDFDSAAVVGKSLENEWNAIHALDSAEQEFSRAAALLGMDPFEIGEADAGNIVRFWNVVDPEIREEALASSTADSLSKVSEWLQCAPQKLAHLGGDSGWALIRETLPQRRTVEPWTQGYTFARAARRQLGVVDERIEFGSNGTPALKHQVEAQPSRSLEGVVSAHGPTCIIAPKPEKGERFLRARAVGDYLSRAGTSLGILSSLHTDRQAMSRAFAAEFLAPAQALGARLKGEFVDEETIESLGDEFGVSTYVISRQIKNHRLGTLVHHSQFWD